MKAARWSLADVILIDEAADLLARTPSLGHVIVDEAQDLSPMQLRAVGRRASTGSVTVLGDLAQATTPWATRSWTESLSHLGHAEAEISELVAGFRVPGAVIDFAARLLPEIAPALTPPHSVRRHRGELDLRRERTPLQPALFERGRRGAGPRGHGRGDRRRRRGGDGSALAGGRRGALRPARRPAAGLQHPGRPGSGHRWPRVWSSTTSYCWNRPTSSPARPTRSPVCAGSTSASPARSPH